MIARSWTARADEAGADAYANSSRRPWSRAALFPRQPRSDVSRPALDAIEGHRGALVLRHGSAPRY